MAPAARIDGQHYTLPDGTAFSVREYVKQQPLRTAWLASRLPGMLELETYWHAVEHTGSLHPDRTLKSDVLAEYEYVSRSAKVRWAQTNGCDVLSPQHDGVVIALRPDLLVADAVDELQAASSAALGYTQPVEKKTMASPVWPDSLRPLPAMGRRWGDSGSGGGSSCRTPHALAPSDTRLCRYCRTQ